MVEIFKHATMITSFVMVMMLIIEYVNVHTRGIWSEKLRHSKWWQLLLAAFLGVIPGCLGTFTVVSLYTHNIINFGALVTVMIATMGDEAFVMFSMMPEAAIKLTVILFVIAIITGFIVNLFIKNKKPFQFNHFEFPLHEVEEDCKSHAHEPFFHRFRRISFPRAIMLFGLILFIVGVATGELGHIHGESETKVLDLPNEIVIEGHELHGHDHGSHEHSEAVTQTTEGQISDTEEHDHSQWNWITITFLLASLVALYIVISGTDHFLDHHLWDHIIKKHFLKIFLWTLGALVLTHFLVNVLDLGDWLQSNLFIILLVAVLIGLIPESGPHLVFVTLFFTGAIPFSILLANSIVQDGHGALPLFAESKKSFAWMKLINLVVGFAVGGLGLWMGF
ncbi:MAG: arsenic efflux protein [Bacteroidales bacterium]|nr:arsenic efflux protein [Bacteroidales bacterium]MCF8457608.1 arsenic efflux protein [Bacteroidales bacterium]